MENIKTMLIKLAFDYYERGQNLDTIAPDSDIKPILEYIKDNFVPLGAVVSPTERTQLTKEEALEILKQGKKITHKYFADGEWMELCKDKLYHYEDGMRATPKMFWEARDGEIWQTGWEIFGE